MNSSIIIIPCYNEAKRLKPEALSKFLRHHDFDLCLVDDGSTDQTAEIINKLSSDNPGRIFTLILRKNRGKAEAVRLGAIEMLQHQYPFIGYFDADLSAPLEEAITLRKHLEENKQLVIAFGSRFARAGSKIERKAYRHYLGRLIATAISSVLGLIIYDTQCGAKLLKSETAKQVFSEPFISRWLFDVEIFGRILQIYGRAETPQKILEVPLGTWRHQDGSKIPLSYAFRIIPDLIKIRLRYR